MHLELLLLKLFRKKIVVTFQGSDARQSDYCKENYEFTYFNHPYYTDQPNFDKQKRQKIAIFNKYADLIYTTNPDLMNILPKRSKFRPYTKLDFRYITPAYSELSSGETIRIIYAVALEKSGKLTVLLFVFLFQIFLINVRQKWIVTKT